MANEAGRGFVDILPDMSGFQQRVGREVEQATSKAQQRATRALQVGGLLTAGVTLPLAAGLKGLTDQASDLQQSGGAVESVFGDAADTIFDFGETSADSFGLAREEVNRLGAQVGAQLKGMGLSADEAAEQTVILQERAADLAATFGGTTSDAISAIAALLRGERDPIERYGVALKQVDINARIASEGMDTSTVAAEKQSQATAALQLLLEQTSDAAGQFAREEDTLAGQTARAEAKFKDAAAALGTELLPIATDVVEIASDMIDVFSSLPDGAQKAILASAGVAAALGPLLTVGGGAVKAVGALNTALGAFRAARAARAATTVATGFEGIGASAAGSIPSVGRLAGKLALYAGLAVGVGKLGQALQDIAGLGDDLDRVGEGIETLGATGQSAVLDEAAGGLDEVTRALSVIADPSFGENVGAGVSRTVDAVGQIFTLGQGPRGSTVQLEQKLQAIDDALAGMVASGNAEDAAAAFDLITEAAAEQGVSTDEALQALPAYADALDAAGEAAAAEGKAQEEGAEGVEENTEAHEEQKSAVDRAREAHEEYTDQLRAAVDPVFALNQALIGVEDAQEAYNEAVEEHGPKSDEARRASLELAEAVSGAEQAAIDGDLSFQQFEGKLRDWVQQGVLTAEQADTMRARVKELRGESEDYEGTYTAYMDARTSDADAGIDALQRRLAELTGRQYTVTIDQQLGRVVRTGEGGIPERAHGGPGRAGELYLTGERGPEFFVPDADGTFMSHDDSIRAMADAIADSIRGQQAARSGPEHVHFHGEQTPRSLFNASDMLARMS